MNDMYTPEVRKMTPYELEQVEIKEEIARVEYKEKLEKGFRIADVFVNRGYLDNFFRADIITERNWREINSVRNLRMCRISKIVFDEKEDYRRSSSMRRKTVQGMEKFINTMQHKKYMAVYISAVSGQQTSVLANI